MNKIKYIMATGGASVALILGLAAPVGAASIDGGNGSDNTTTQTVTDTDTTNIDRSRTVSGDCSAIIDTDVYQSASNSVDDVKAGNDGDVENEVEQVLLVEDEQNIDQNNSASNSQSNSQSSSVNFNADCSESNVTNVTQAAQVDAPKGGVGAGAGAATSAQALLGLFGSVGTTGLGLGLRFLKRGA